MPGYVQEFLAAKKQEQQEQAYDKGYRETLAHLERDLGERYRNDDYTINGYKPEQWSAQHERIAIQQIGHSENQWIQRARNYVGGPAGQYGDLYYRMGARHAVMAFSHEHNHRLLEAIRIEENSLRQVHSQGIRIKAG